ncbi:serine/threonine protein kinase [Pontiella sulfatireligans]|uniref:Serine/threonine-protein kinase PknD n=1 Tax=Pontiella sulfatireligans TaxID=2750658 RepID=A0A6C2UD17_9BACT|nr:serine/threonine-protein kinase [Pontiella sulfatireligans]VGO18040.1 Serine/threonine-protein kinase PknD [Pontiella sulfatireligans]
MPENPKSNNEREKRFRRLDEGFRDFYDADLSTISEEEEASLTPILNSVGTYSERYQTLGEIAEGGEKKITLVYDHRLDRQVAMAHAVHAKTKAEQERFLREARLTANLAHPNIMPVHNMGVDQEGIPFFTMELIGGDSLKDIIAKLRDGDEAYQRNYPLTKLLDIYIKICDAAAYAHSRNVLHLDLKPENIQVGEFGEVFVCDWGLARVMHSEDPKPQEIPGTLDADILNDMTLSGMMKGTPGFMAPEQVVADSEKTPQTDIYALGAVLYQLLTHETPVRGDSANEIIQNTRAGKIIPPHRQNPEKQIPKSLCAAALKALSLKPENRYGSVVELKQEINRYLSGYPTHAENASPITTLTLLIQRHSRITFLLLFFLLLLAGVMSVNLAIIEKAKRRAEIEHKQAEQNFQLYREEQQAVIQLNEDLGDALVSTMQSPTFLNLDLTLRVLDAGISKDLTPEHYKKLMVKKGTIHFMLYQFNAASECFEKAGEDQTRPIKTICDLSREYATLKTNDKQDLSNQQMADLIAASGHTNARITLILHYMYLYHIRSHTNPSPEDYLPLATAMLDKLNKIRTRTEPLQLTRRTEGWHLNLAGTEYREFKLKIDAAYELNVLKPLNLYSLDISHTPISNLAELSGIELKELRMVGLHLHQKNLAGRFRLFELEKVVIDADAYPKLTMNRLREDFEVIDVPASP